MPDKYYIEDAKKLFEAVFDLERMTAEFDEGDFNRILMACGNMPTPIEYLVHGIKNFYGKNWRPLWADDKHDYYQFKEVSIEWTDEGSERFIPGCQEDMGWIGKDPAKLRDEVATYVKHKHPEAVGFLWHPTNEDGACIAVMAYTKQDAQYESHWPFWLFGKEGEDAPGDAAPNQD